MSAAAVGIFERVGTDIFLSGGHLEGPDAMLLSKPEGLGYSLGDRVDKL